MKPTEEVIGRDLRTGEFVSDEVRKTNPDRYERIVVKAYADPRITLLRAMIYEPEHIEGGVCWCGVKYQKIEKGIEIKHTEQRDLICNYVQKILPPEDITDNNV